MIIKQLLYFLAVISLLWNGGEASADTKDSLNERLEYLRDHPDDKRALKDVAYYYLNLADYDNAMKYGEMLVKIGETTGDRSFAELHGRIVIGELSIMTDNSEMAYRSLETALLIAEDIEDHNALSSIHNGFGLYYQYNLTDLYSALSHFFVSLEEAQRSGNKRRYAIVLSNTAEAFLLRNDISGLKYAEKAHELALGIGESLPLYYACLNLAQFYVMSGQLDKVESLLCDIDKYAKLSGCFGEADVSLLKTRYYNKRGDVKRAMHECRNALDRADNVPGAIKTMAYLEYARLFKQQNDWPEAIRSLNLGLDNSRKVGVSAYVGDVLRELSLCHKQAGELDKGFDYSLRYSEYLDSSFNMTRERALQEARIKHDVYQQETQIRQQKLEIRSAKIRLFAMIAIAFVLIFILGFAIYSYRRRNRLYKAIVIQNNEHLNRERILTEQIEKLKLNSNKYSASSFSEEKAEDLMMRFSDMMTEHKLYTDQSLTVQSMAERLGTNRTYLSRAVNEITGKTFPQLVNDYRIREAIRLISDTEVNIPLKQICREVGFSSMSTFYAIFQTSTGMTPALYRAKLKDI